MKKRILSEDHKRKIGEANKKAHPIKLYTYICKSCGKSFMSRQKNRIFCSTKCYNDFKLFDKICDFCGNTFKAKTHNVKYCLNCRTKKCEMCGKSFVLSSREVIGTKYNIPKKYCSQECFHKSSIGKIPWNKKEGVKFNCLICDKEFIVLESRLKRNVKYCSSQCKHIAQSKVIGEDHPLWKGGFKLYSILMAKNEGSFHMNRIEVLKRDNYTCQYWGLKGESKYMDVHHIIKVRDGGSNLLDNLITLCRKCHNNADRGYISIRKLKQKISA